MIESFHEEEQYDQHDSCQSAAQVPGILVSMSDIPTKSRGVGVII